MVWRRGSTEARDVVLFLADEQWHCFDQLAAALRRRHVVPLRVVTTGRRGLITRIIDHAVYRGVIDLRRRSAVGVLDRLTTDGRVRDVQVDERTFMAMDHDTEAARRLEALDRLPWAQRRARYDKVALAATLAAAGIRTAPVLVADCTTPDQAVADLGLPLVVKRRTGTGGREVRVVYDTAGLPGAVAELGGPTAVFFQPYLEGEVRGYGAVVRNGIAIREGTAVERKSRVDPLGPTAWLEPCADDTLTHAGRVVAAAIAPDGLFAIEFLVAADGGLCVIDVCMRAWGSFLAWTADGVDFVEAYLDAIGVARSPCRSTARFHDAPIAVFPVALDDLVDAQSRIVGTRATWRLARRNAPHVGIAYCTIVVLQRAIDRHRRARRISDLAIAPPAGLFGH